MSGPVWYDRADEIGPLMRSKSEGCWGKGRLEKRTVVNIGDGARRSKGGGRSVRDRFHGDRAVLGWGDQT